MCAQRGLPHGKLAGQREAVRPICLHGGELVQISPVVGSGVKVNIKNGAAVLFASPGDGAGLAKLCSPCSSVMNARAYREVVLFSFGVHAFLHLLAVHNIPRLRGMSRLASVPRCSRGRQSRKAF
jgi:CRP-like cAMP-binding protein